MTNINSQINVGGTWVISVGYLLQDLWRDFVGSMQIPKYVAVT